MQIGSLKQLDDLGCSKSELIMDTIRTKTELQDWQGLYELTRHLTTNNPSRDMPLTAFLTVQSRRKQKNTCRSYWSHQGVPANIATLPDLPQRTLFSEKVFIEFYVYRKKKLFLKR